jgi:hypothetical protein
VRGNRIEISRVCRSGPPLTVPCQSFDLLPGLHPTTLSVSNEKRILLSIAGRYPTLSFGRYMAVFLP